MSLYARPNLAALSALLLTVLVTLGGCRHDLRASTDAAAPDTAGRRDAGVDARDGGSARDLGADAADDAAAAGDAAADGTGSAVDAKTDAKVCTPPCRPGSACRNGVCVCDTTTGCTGCCNGDRCTKQADTSCGLGGVACTDCSATPTKYCAAATGTCCGGCVDTAEACQVGNTKAACRKLGTKACEVCKPPNGCVQAQCNAGTGCSYPPNSMSICFYGASAYRGTCISDGKGSAYCCIGCITTGNSCVAGNQRNACGRHGSACQDCGPLNCVSNECTQ